MYSQTKFGMKRITAERVGFFKVLLPSRFECEYSCMALKNMRFEFGF